MKQCVSGAEVQGGGTVGIWTSVVTVPVSLSSTEQGEGCLLEMDQAVLHLLSEGARAVACVPPALGQTHAAETSCFANMTHYTLLRWCTKLHFLLTSPSAHGESH